MKKIISIFVLILLFSVSFSSVLAMGHTNGKAHHHPTVPEQSIGKISPNAAHGMHTAWKAIQNSNGNARHVFQMRFKPVGHPKVDEVELKSVKYEGYGDTFGSYKGDVITFTFSDYIKKDGEIKIYFEEAQEFRESWGKADYDVAGKTLTVTTTEKWNNPRPEVGDRVIDIKGIVDTGGEEVTIPKDGVKVY